MEAWNIDRTFGEKLEDHPYFDREGAYLLAVENGMLAAVRTPTGLFLPGGGLENGESFWECVRRECLEELGRDAEAGEYLGTAEQYFFHQAIGYFHPVQHFFTGRLSEQLQQPQEKDHWFQWVLLTEAAEAMYLPTQRWAAGRLLENKAGKSGNNS